MRILVIKPSSLGDIVHGLVAAETIRREFPGAKIDWVARDTFAPLVAACPTVSRVYVFQRGAGPAAFLRLIREIRGTHYDLALDMQGLARSAILCAAARADRRIVRADGREGSRLLIREHATLPPHPSHAVEKLLGFLPNLGVKKIIPATPDFPARELPSSAAALPAKRAITLFPDSRRPEKEWPRFAELAAALDARLPDHALVIGGGPARAGEPAFPARALDLRGKTTLTEAVALIRHSAICVCNDSGPMHIAAALGTPVVALFGPTDPALYGPFPLSRKTHRTLIAPGGDLAALGVETVAEAVVETLGKTGA